MRNANKSNENSTITQASNLSNMIAILAKNVGKEVVIV